MLVSGFLDGTTNTSDIECTSPPSMLLKEARALLGAESCFRSRVGVIDSVAPAAGPTGMCCTDCGELDDRSEIEGR